MVQPNAYRQSMCSTEVIDRIGNYTTLLKAGVPVPFSAICRDSSEVTQFFSAARRQGHRDIVVKEHHRKLTAIQSMPLLQVAIENVRYPLLAEAVYTAISSPVAQSVCISTALSACSL